MKTSSITALASCLCVLGSGFTSHALASSGRAHFGFEVITSGEIGLEMNEGQVLLRDLVSGSTSTYSASTTLSLSEGRYLIAANTIDASFALSWTTQSVGEGDLTISSIEANDAHLTYHPSEDIERIWMGTGPDSSSSLELGVTAPDGEATRSLMWVNDVIGTDSFSMPAEGSDEVGTVFPEGSHAIVLGPRSLASLRLDPGSDSDGSGDGGSDGAPGANLRVLEIAADEFSLESVLGGTNSVFTITVDLNATECPGDLDGDGQISGADLGILLGLWGSSCP